MTASAFATSLGAPGGRPRASIQADPSLNSSSSPAAAAPRGGAKLRPTSSDATSASVSLSKGFVAAPQLRRAFRGGPAPTHVGFGTTAVLDNRPVIPPPASPLKPNIPPPFSRPKTPRVALEELEAFREPKEDDTCLHEAHDADSDVAITIVERRVPGHGHMLLVRAEGQDRPGLLSDLLGTLRDFEYPVFHAHIRTQTQSHHVVDDFYVRFSDCSPWNIAGDGVARLFEALLSVCRDDHVYHPGATALEEVDMAGYECSLSGTVLEVGDHPEKPDWSLIEIRCKDQDYLLFEVTSALKGAGVAVLSAEISTDREGSVHDRIVVGAGPDGGRLGPAQREAVMERLRQTLCKLEFQAARRAAARAAEAAGNSGSGSGSPVSRTR